jgi:hypothetical protein
MAGQTDNLYARYQVYPDYSGNPHLWPQNDIVVTTLDRYSHKLFDNITTAIPLLKRFKEGKRLMLINGGANLEEPIMQGINTTPSWYWLDDTFVMKTDDILARAVYSWRQMVATVRVAGSELRQNAGDETKKFDLLKTRIHNMELSFMNNLAGHMYTNTTQSTDANMLLTINPLDFLVSINPNIQSSVGGLSRIEGGTNPLPAYSPYGGKWWQNQVWDLMTDSNVPAGGDPTPKQLLAAMSQFVRNLTRNNERPSIIIMSDYFYGLYENALRDTKTIVSTGIAKGADSEVSNLTFSGIPIMWDVNCPKNLMYFLNEEYLKFKVHSGANFKTEEPRTPVDKDIKIYPMIFMGQMTLSNSHLQGVMRGALNRTA